MSQTLYWSKSNGGQIRLAIFNDGSSVRVGPCFEARVSRQTLPAICSDILQDYPGVTPMEDTGALSLSEHIDSTLF